MRLSESLQLALDTNKRFVKEKDNLISNQKDIIASLKSDKYAPDDECRKLLPEKEKELDRCVLEINTMTQNAPHSNELSKIKVMISQKDHALLGQLKAIEELSIDVQRLAKDKEILTRKFDAEATLRSGLKKRYEDQIHITSKTELAFNLKDELLRAKDKTIRSLKATLSYHKNCQPDLSESVPNNEQTAGLLDNANIGVKESCEFIALHATNGVILNGLLLWVDIHRKSNIWKMHTVNKFVSEEITEAKELLWRTADESIVGKLVKRQGANKGVSEINDICSALKLLSEKDSLPMFMGTSIMVAQTPVYRFSSPDNDSSVVDNMLKTIEESIKSLVASTCMKEKTAIQTTPTHQIPSSNNSKPLGVTTELADETWANITAVSERNESITPLTQNENDNLEGEWKEVKTSKDRRNWRQKANIVRGTAKCETGRESLSADIHLVLYGLAKHVTSLQLSRFIEHKGLKIGSCDLLTKYEGAHSLSFKITRSSEYDKVRNPEIWPVGVGSRLFKFLNTHQNKNGDERVNIRNENKDRNNRGWQLEPLARATDEEHQFNYRTQNN